jgi:hypothetical protein
MPTKTTAVTVTSYPTDQMTERNFEVKEMTMPKCTDGHMIVKTMMISVDPCIQCTNVKIVLKIQWQHGSSLNQAATVLPLNLQHDYNNFATFAYIYQIFASKWERSNMEDLTRLESQLVGGALAK